MTGLTFNKTEAGFNTSRRDVSDSLRLEPINEYYTENLVKKKQFKPLASPFTSRNQTN